ncbi:hypothetical protein AYI68_g302 [Smittium mucronatum]|uniref:Zn(2)-C6 fungal-type domain-containing protein n=1 Tax=Smittium mucronatum TaxID=133383 RepID=A0A1R0H8S7_9FUNG|nr:hypothetical protein AYI68_g302 [Smittium mucronatum]
MPVNSRKNVFFEESSADSFRVSSNGSTLYSCDFCREKKVKCDGTRPKCGICASSDRFCQYKEVPVFTKEKLGDDPLEKRLLKINTALNKIKDFSKYAPPSKRILAVDSIQGLNNVNGDLKSVLNDSSFISASSGTCCTETLSNNPDSLLENSVIEIGFLGINDELCLKVMERFFVKSIYSLTLSKGIFIERFKNGDIPNYMKYSLLSFGAKLLDEYTIFKGYLYMCGSSYADKAFEILTSQSQKVSLSIRYCIFLGIHKIDGRRRISYKSLDEWREVEYKRRVFWLTYYLNVTMALNLGNPDYIQLEDISVNLPSNDQLYKSSKNYDAISEQEELDLLNSNLNAKSRVSSDEFWILVKIIIILNIVSSFVNRKRTRLYSNYDIHFVKSDRINKTLNFFESAFKEHYKCSGFCDIVSDKIDIMDKNQIAEKYFVPLSCGIFFNMARIILNKFEIVHYSLSSSNLLRAKRSKIMCIDCSIQISDLLMWSYNKLIVSHINALILRSANTSVIVLNNVLNLKDHPKHDIILRSFRNLTFLFKKYSLILKVSSEYVRSIRNNNEIHRKSISSNSKYLKLFPELEISRITDTDTNLWFLKPVSTEMVFSCCSIHINCPMYKYPFIKNWFNSEVMYTRSSEYPLYVNLKDLKKPKISSTHFNKITSTVVPSTKRSIENDGPKTHKIIGSNEINDKHNHGFIGTLNACKNNNQNNKVDADLHVTPHKSEKPFHNFSENQSISDSIIVLKRDYKGRVFQITGSILKNSHRFKSNSISHSSKTQIIRKAPTKHQPSLYQNTSKIKIPRNKLSEDINSKKNSISFLLNPIKDTQIDPYELTSK